MCGCCMSQDQLEDAKNVAELTEDIANKAGAEKIAEMAGNVSTSFDAIEGVTDALECFQNGDMLEGADHLAGAVEDAAEVTQSIAEMAGADDIAEVADMIGENAEIAGDLAEDALEIAQLIDAKNVAELTEDIANKAGAEKIAEMAGNVSTSFDAIEGVTDALECFQNGDMLEGADHLAGAVEDAAEVTQSIAEMAGADDIAEVADMIGENAEIAGDLAEDALEIAKECCTVM